MAQFATSAQFLKSPSNAHMLWEANKHRELQNKVIIERIHHYEALQFEALVTAAYKYMYQCSMEDACEKRHFDAVQESFNDDKTFVFVHFNQAHVRYVESEALSKRIQTNL